MQPAVFDDGQLLATTHYHVDACLWKADTFIHGATFLMPSKLPEAGLEKYSVDLDDTTGIYHVVLRKVSLRTSLALMQSSKPDYSSHFVEFSNGDMTAVPRIDCTAISLECEIQQIPLGEHQCDMAITQPEPVDHQYTGSHSSLAGSSVSTPHETTSDGTIPAPAGLDSSITSFGRVVGQRAADDHSNLCTFSESIFHIIPRKARASSWSRAEDSNTAGEAQEPVTTALDIQASETHCPSRRSSAASQDSGIPLSTAPTSPRSLTPSTEPFEKLALAFLPEIPVAPRKPSYVVKALALEEVKHENLKKAIISDSAVLRRLGLDLGITHRQLTHLDKIQDSESPCVGQELRAPKSGLAIIDGQIIMASEGIVSG